MEEITNIKLKTIITEEVVRDGKTILKQVSENLTPNTGLAGFIKRMGGDVSTDGFTYLALGTGTTAAAAADIALEAEIIDSGLSRASATVSYETTTTTDDTLQLYKSFTATGSKNVSEIGIFNDASAGIMGGRVVKTAVPLEANDVYNITYQIVLARA
jgi:hypothetical protein